MRENFIDRIFQNSKKVLRNKLIYNEIIFFNSTTIIEA